MRDIKDRILDIWDAIEQIEEYSPKGKDYFSANKPIQSHFILQIQIIGEVAFKLPDDFKIIHPEIPWDKIEGMRHSLVHGYFNIDLEIVWNVVQNNIPEIKPFIRKLIAELSDTQ